jgi:hypothetical protein
MILFVLGVGGLVPLSVVNSRQAKKLHDRVPADVVHYLTPSTDEWSAKLGNAASVSFSQPSAEILPPTLVDNSDSGFYVQYPWHWSTQSLAGTYNGTYRRNTLYQNSGWCRWKFTDLEPGYYEIHVTYPASASHSTVAPYIVFDDFAEVGSVTVNQTAAPSGPAYAGVNWKNIGLYAITSGTLRVRLVSIWDKYVAADAVRIVPVVNDVTIVSVQESPASDEITVEALVQP